MISANVLLISDDLELGQVRSLMLKQRGLSTTIVTPSDEDSTERRLPEHSHDLIIIEAHRQQLNIMNTIHRLRTETTVPILLLTPHDDELGVLAAYEAGVDEVITLPIGPKIFQAKALAWQRRSWTVPTTMLDSLKVGILCLDPARRELVTDTGTVFKITTLEFRLLHLLMSHPNQVLDSTLIINRIWGNSGGGDNASLKNIVYRLRRKIEPDPANPRYIQVAPGEGYLFVA
jgi:DNA-binding response OmpR family regulator